MITTTFEPAS